MVSHAIPAAIVLVVIVLVTLAAVIDLRSGRIPDRLTGWSGFLGFALVVWDGIARSEIGVLGLLWPHVAAGALATALFYGIRVLGVRAYGTPGMGWGDIKLAGVLGLLLGWNALWALYLSAVFGSLFGVAGRLSGRLARLERIRFAPFIAAGTYISLGFDLGDLMDLVGLLSGAG